jgi:hypothetical protein
VGKPVQPTAQGQIVSHARSQHDREPVSHIEENVEKPEPRFVAREIARTFDEIDKTVTSDPAPNAPLAAQGRSALPVPSTFPAVKLLARADESNVPDWPARATPADRGTSAASVVPVMTQASATAAGEAVSTIRVHIGRIEVRAVAAPPPAQQPAAPKPVASRALKDYLRDRSERRR